MCSSDLTITDDGRACVIEQNLLAVPLAGVLNVEQDRHRAPAAARGRSSNGRARGRIVEKRRAWDSNPQPVTRHHNSNVAASQFAYPPNRPVSSGSPAVSPESGFPRAGGAAFHRPTDPRSIACGQVAENVPRAACGAGGQEAWKALAGLAWRVPWLLAMGLVSTIQPPAEHPLVSPVEGSAHTSCETNRRGAVSVRVRPAKSTARACSIR